MIPKQNRSATRHCILGACLALSTSSCLTPPPAAKSAPDAEVAANDGSDQSATTASASVVAPKAFTHTSEQLVSHMKLGWNLGNSLDVPDGETKWGNPKVSAELLQLVKAAGFRIVRIPVTWSGHMGPGPEYTIDPTWLARVDEVVGYARDAGLYSIINLHHDGADGFQGVEWITLNDAEGNTTQENNAHVKARFVTVWQQIAKYFAGYGEELLFESMNEIHDGYGPPDPRHFVFVNQLNQTFVNVVRRSGGNNAQRHLVVPGYNTNIEHTIKGFKLPSDPTPNRIILSVHYYDPYLYALQAKTNTWGKASPGSDDWGQEDFVLKQFDLLKANFIDKGLPVLIGEYGATQQDGFEDYRRYYMEYVTKAAIDRGILPIYWDNGGRGSGGENFALFDRDANKVLRPKILEAMLRAATKDYKLEDVATPAK